MAGILEELLPMTKDYQLEALSDETRLRVIIWPRHSGKSYFIALDTIKISQFPRAHAIIVHADEGEYYSMKSKWMMSVNPELYTCVTYKYLANHMERIIDQTRGKNLWLYFEEPDLYPDDDMTSASVITAFCAIASMDGKTSIQQVTYIGTASEIGNGSRLAKMGEFVPIVHTAHPREIWPDDWVEDASALSAALDTDVFRTEVMGNY